MPKTTLESLEKRLVKLENFVKEAFQLQVEGVDKKATVKLNEDGKAEVVTEKGD